MKKEDQKNKKKFIELWKDKKERAKIELALYGIFFLGVIIFVRVLGSTSNNVQNIPEATTSFIYTIQDNYEYNMIIEIDNNTYEYYGKVLGNNSTINLKTEDITKSYYLTNKKYYILDNENYILTNEEEVYPYIDYHYLNVDNIREYITMSVRENDTYKIKISDILLNSESTDFITISIDEEDKNIIIDYTQLLKLTKENIDKAAINITLSNINNITSLEE